MQKTKRLVLQVGESTHMHTLSSETDIEFEELTSREEGVIRFILNERGILTHEEHEKMVFDKGTYVKFPQIEFDPLVGNIRQVFD